MTTRLYREGRLAERGFAPRQIAELVRTDHNIVWLDIEEPTHESIALLGEQFGFHELALEDCLHPHQRPKIEQYRDYFFLVAYGATVEDGRLVHHEIAAFVGHNYLVTVRKPPAYDLQQVLRRWDAHSELASEGGGYLLYVLLDEVVDGYFDVVDVYQDRAEEIEAQVFGSGEEADVQNRIFGLKKDLIEFRRRVAPLRDVLDVLQRGLVEVVTERLEPYYRDVYDHVLRAADFVDSLRELLSSALDASLAVVSNRVNEVVKRLTSWAAIILVPTFIAGVYGMNFREMPELSWPFGYPFALGLMVASGVILWGMFRRRGWL